MKGMDLLGKYGKVHPLIWHRPKVRLKQGNVRQGKTKDMRLQPRAGSVKTRIGTWACRTVGALSFCEL